MNRIVFFIAISVWATSLMAQSPEKVAQIVGEVVEKERIEQNIHGVTVGVIKGGKILHTGAYGYADFEHRQPLTTETVMNWASISKTFTAVMAWQLMEDDMTSLTINDKVGPIVPNWPPTGDPEFAEKWNITVGELMSHSSRIGHYPTINDDRSEFDIADNEIWDAQECLETFNTEPLLPDEPWATPEYSTFAYNLLGAVIEEKGAGYVRQATSIGKALELESLRAAQTTVEGWGRECSDPREFTTTDFRWVLPGGGWQSDIDDLTELIKNIFWGQRLLGNVSAMWQNIPNNEDYRYGVYDTDYTLADGSSIQVINHGGAHRNLRNFFGYMPSQDLAIVLMCNTRGVSIERLYREIARAMGVPFMENNNFRQISCNNSTMASDDCQTTTFSAIWEPSSNQRLLRRGYRKAAFSKEFTYLRDQGYQCLDVEVQTGADGATRWDAVFFESSSRRLMNSNLTMTNLQASVGTRERQGYYPADLESYEVNGTMRWVAIYNRGEAVTELRLTPKAYSNKMTEMADAGYRLIEMEPYLESGNRYVAAVWIPGTAARSAINLSEEDVRTRTTQLERVGYRLASVEPYLTAKGSRLRYAAIWHRTGIQRDWSTHTSCGLSQRYNQHNQQISDFERMFTWASEL